MKTIHTPSIACSMLSPVWQAEYRLSASDNKGFIGSVGFDRLIQVMPSRMRNYFKVNTYLFGDVGVIDYTNIIEKKSFSKPRFDAGLGTAFTIKKWGALQMVEPLTLRFDMPFFISNTPNVSPEYVKFRWLISVSRAF